MTADVGHASREIGQNALLFEPLEWLNPFAMKGDGVLEARMKRLEGEVKNSNRS